MTARRPVSRLLPRSPRGSVILLVLGVILLAAFLMTKLMDRAATELQVESRAVLRASLRDEAYSALQVTLAVLADFIATQGALHTPAEGWDQPLAFANHEPAAGRRAHIIFEDLSGRLSLPASDEASLQRLLLGLGLAQLEAERLADAIFGWTRPDHVARFPESDPARYLTERTPYAVPGRPLRSLEEMRAIPTARDLLFDESGDWNELGQRFRAAVSVHRFERINVNTATPLTLIAAGLDPARADTLTDSRARLDTPRRWFRSASEAAQILGPDLDQPALGAEITCLRIRLTVTEGGRQFFLDAIVQPSRAGAGRTPEQVPADPAVAENAARPWTLKNIDYPFPILELRESDLPTD